MILYALLSVPLLLYLYVGLGVISRPLDPPVFRRPLLKGAASFPFFAALLLVMTISMEKRFSQEELFRYFLLRDALVIPFLVGGCSRFATRKLLLRGDWELFTGMLVYTGTVYTLLALTEIAVGGHYYGPYDLFLRPTLRLVQLTVLTASVVTVIRHQGSTRWIAVLAILALPPVTAYVGTLEATFRLLPSLFLTILLLGIGVVAIGVGPALGYVKPRPD